MAKKENHVYGPQLGMLIMLFQWKFSMKTLMFTVVKNYIAWSKFWICEFYFGYNFGFINLSNRNLIEWVELVHSVNEWLTDFTYLQISKKQ